MSRLVTIGLVFVASIGALVFFRKYGATTSSLLPRSATNTAIESSAERPTTATVESTASTTEMSPSTNRAVLSALAKEPQRAILSSQIGRFSNEEEEELLIIYRSITNPIGRFGILHALACGGGNRTFDTFKFTLEREFTGKTLNLEDEEMLLITGRFLGLLASHSPAAWEYLKAGCFRRHWAAMQKWSGPRLDIDSYLANYCIQGIGICDRADARAFLEQLKANLTLTEARDSYSAIVVAAAKLDIAEEYGRTKFLDEIFMKESEYEFFINWKASEKAKPWLEWMERTKRAR